MWLEELDGAEHTEPADVSRKASNIVFFPASKHVSELGTRGSPAPATTRRSQAPLSVCSHGTMHMRRLSHVLSPSHPPRPNPLLFRPAREGCHHQWPFCHRRINYLSGRRLSEEFISQGRQRCRGRRASFLNYSSSSLLLWSPRWLLSILFCQPATRAPVSLRPISDRGKDCK